MAQIEPAEFLWMELQKHHLTAAEAAAELGVTRQQVHNLLAGKSAISPPMALRLEAVFEIQAEKWLAMQAASDLARLRRNS